MKVKEVFQVGDLIQSIGGLTVFLDRDNCQVRNKQLKDDSVLLELRRDSDGEEGHAYLRVINTYEQIEDQLLKWSYRDERMIGLTLNQLALLDVNAEITSINGKMMFAPQEA